MHKKLILIQILTFAFLLPKAIFAQDINVKIGIKINIESEILQENRTILIHLPDGILQKQVVEFSNSIADTLSNYLALRYLTYENEDHVPYHSLYDGLKFVFVSSPGH